MDTQLTEALNQLLTTVATIAIGAVTLWVQQALKQWKDEKRRAFVLPLFTTALVFARDSFEAGAVPTKEAIIEKASNYMFDHAADALKALGLDYSGVEQALEARVKTVVPSVAS